MLYPNTINIEKTGQDFEIHRIPGNGWILYFQTTFLQKKQIKEEKRLCLHENISKTIIIRTIMIDHQHIPKMRTVGFFAAFLTSR